MKRFSFTTKIASFKDKLAKKKWQEYIERISIEFIKSSYFSIKWIFHYSGLEFIYRKFNPSKQPKSLPTGIIWLVGIYMAFFVLASQKYENRIDIIENRANSIITQLAVPSLHKKALSSVSRVQNMHCPRKPNILNPPSVFISLFKDSKYIEMIDHLKETVEDWKDSLDSVNLSQAILWRSNLRQANLKEADLSNADLRQAILQEANFRNANLQSASLQRADLRKANLVSAGLRGANLQNANIRGANLQQADLQGANLLGVDLQGADLQGANLRGTNLRGANLQRASFLGADLQQAFFRGSDFQYSNLWGADLRKADLEGANLRRAGFQHTNLWKANLQAADLRDAFFQGASLQEAILQKADFQGAILRGADLRNADLGGAKALTVEQLCEASNLFEAKLDQELEAQIRNECSGLFIEPQTAKENTSGVKK